MNLRGKFYGLGVGPGDPELLTLKAVNILNKVDYICVPQAGEDKESLALSIVEKNIDCEGRKIKLHFPMTCAQEELDRNRDLAAAKIKRHLNSGENLAFITIGDPLLYSTYIYILNRLKKAELEYKIETVPGITSFSASTAGYNLPLARNNDNIAILADVEDESKLEETLNNFETTVIMKLPKNFQTVYEVLEKLGLKKNAIMVSKCGQKEGFYTEDLDSLNADEIEYLSLLIVKQEGI